MRITQLILALALLAAACGKKAGDAAGNGSRTAALYLKYTTGDDWGDKLTSALRAVAGVSDVTVEKEKERVLVQYDEQKVGEDAIRAAVQQAGFDVRPKERVQLHMPDIDSANCVVLVRKALENVEGVTSIETSVQNKVTWVEYVDGVVRPAQLIRELSSSLDSRVERMTYSERDHALYRQQGR